jgi:hypothetical protein
VGPAEGNAGGQQQIILVVVHGILGAGQEIIELERLATALFFHENWKNYGGDDGTRTRDLCRDRVAVR